MSRVPPPGRPPLLIMFPGCDKDEQRALHERRRQDYRERVKAWKAQEEADNEKPSRD